MFVHITISPQQFFAFICGSALEAYPGLFLQMLVCKTAYIFSVQFKPILRVPSGTKPISSHRGHTLTLTQEPQLFAELMCHIQIGSI